MMFIGYVVAETNFAIYFWEHFWEEPDWFPKSQITMYRDIDTHEVRVLASEWVCQQKDIQEYEHRRRANNDI